MGQDLFSAEQANNPPLPRKRFIHKRHNRLKMNINKIPTPETDAETYKPGEDCYRRSLVDAEFARDLERRLAIARAFIRQVKESSSSSRLQREAKEALTQTAPKL